MNRLIAVTALILGLGLVLPARAAVPQTVSGAKTVNAQQAKKLFDKGVVFIDLRRDRFFAAGRVPDAVHIEFRKIYSETTLGQHVKKNQPVVMYFDDCKRCAKSIEMAVAWGYKKVYFFRSGFTAWKTAGYPVE